MEHDDLFARFLDISKHLSASSLFILCMDGSEMLLECVLNEMEMVIDWIVEPKDLSLWDRSRNCYWMHLE